MPNSLSSSCNHRCRQRMGSPSWSAAEVWLPLLLPDIPKAFGQQQVANNSYYYCECEAVATSFSGYTIMVKGIFQIFRHDHRKIHDDLPGGIDKIFSMKIAPQKTVQKVWKNDCPRPGRFGYLLSGLAGPVIHARR
ncbi:MAG: hypothetical protein IIC56_11385 [Proteobacteria bacterium]|nr:hypothetical protein [Pseudomonadota bacterium]